MRVHRLRVGAFAALGALAGSFLACGDASKPAPAAEKTAPALGEIAARAALARAPLGHVASRNERGFARFVAGALEFTFLAISCLVAAWKMSRRNHAWLRLRGAIIARVPQPSRGGSPPRAAHDRSGRQNRAVHSRWRSRSS